MGITGSKSTESLDAFNESNGDGDYGGGEGYAASTEDPYGHGHQSQEMQIPTIRTADLATMDSDAERIPMVFRWNHPAQEVWLAGTFTGWEKVRMHRSGNDFSYIIGIPKGKHCYRFFVNDQWQCASDQPPVRNLDDNELYNLADLTNFLSLEEEYLQTVARDKDLDEYCAIIPTFDDDFIYSTEPPHLPPHLRKIILNQSSASYSSGEGGGASPEVGNREDSTELAQANHVTLNHLYCTAMKHGLMVLGTTFRYKQKCVTTVYYSVATNMGAV